MEQEILQLEEQVKNFMKWKNARMSERLTNPLDYQSRKTLNYWTTKFFSGLLVTTGKTYPSYVDLLTDFTAFGLEVNLNGQNRILLCMFVPKQFTANPTTDIITASDGAHNLKNGDRIAFTTDQTLPAGLNIITLYYVINRSSTTFKVSTTLGGSPVNITDAGTGSFYYVLT